MKPISKEFKRAVLSAIVFMFFLGFLGNIGFDPSLAIDRLMIRHFGEKDFCLMAYNQEFMRGEHVPMYCFKHLMEYSR